MSRIYNPHKWAMLKITSKAHGVIYKVLGSWYGGFAGSDSWKLSSGSTSASYDKDTGVLTFPQCSGSTYTGAWENYGMSMYTAGILAMWQKELEDSEDSIEVMEENFDIALVSLK